jgi:hypothetical protein
VTRIFPNTNDFNDNAKRPRATTDKKRLVGRRRCIDEQFAPKRVHIGRHCLDSTRRTSRAISKSSRASMTRVRTSAPAAPTS